MRDWIDEAAAAYPGNGADCIDSSIYDAAVALFGRRKAREMSMMRNNFPRWQAPDVVQWRWAVREVDRTRRQFYRDEEPELRFANRGRQRR